MSEPSDLDATLEEMKTKASQVKSALGRVRGTGTAGNGTVTAIVDSAGHLRDLELTRDALRWGDRLASLILQATAAAEKDAAAKAEQAMHPLIHDERVEAGIKTIRETFGQAEPRTKPPRPMTEEEIQAADDAYFERMNRQGWNR
ncbi:YbaB/EbfC family nucleoid-associated protein [Nocardia amamiensis]|uniref:YbaB/EbfC family nucleoid-associated protein n=1 Tax=Nocardia amamiensis TaxID=404578 RepID=A0ABS0D2C5_9NOCA|nr:YbaB/EbfC family nucleoid-associated protein [Nocardia amamiensis]MBF6302992.1 YbaB/EbfC family nucleoid-associated protein [Nocardia amamiensis]